MRPPTHSTTTLSRSQLVLASVIASVVYPVVWLLGRTVRWTICGYQNYEEVRRIGRQPIFAFWHGRILTSTYFWRRRNIVVMTSANFDGEWIARIIERFGYGTARGSTSRGGHRALSKLRSEMRAGYPAAFTVDGPRGPFRSVQLGAVWLSRLTGNPIVPFHIECDRYWSVRSWDRAQIPKPFARAVISIGKPIFVRSVDDSDQLEATRKTLEEALYDELRRAERELGKADRGVCGRE